MTECVCACVCVCLTSTVSLEGVPDVAVEVVVSGQQQAAALGEGHGGDAADDVVVGVDHHLLVRAQVKQPAGGVVRACGKRVPVGEELHAHAHTHTHTHTHTNKSVSACVAFDV